MPNLLVRLEALPGNLFAGLTAAEGRIKRFGSEVEQTLATTARSSRQFQHDLAIGLGATSAIIGGALGFATKSAIDFERSMRNVATIARNQDGTRLTERQFHALGDTIADLSTRVPQSAKVLADAMYQIVSTGFQGEEAMQVLKASAVAASAGLTDAGTAASGIVTVLKAYGENGFHAAEVSNTLFQAVNLGAFSFEGLASSMGQFVALAAQLGVSFNDAAAGMAIISLTGRDAAESSTLLNRVFTAFIRPTEALSQKMAELHLSIDDLKDTGGLIRVLESLKASVGGNAQALAQFFPDVRELGGVLALTANDGKNATEVMKAFNDPVERATAAQAAFNEQAKGVGFQMTIARNQISAAGLAIGNSFLPLVGKAAEFVTNLVAAFGLLPSPIRTFLAVAASAVAVTAGLGAVALFAVPKVAAFQAAMAGLGKTAVKTAGELAASAAATEAQGDAAVIAAGKTGAAGATAKLQGGLAALGIGGASEAAAVGGAAAPATAAVGGLGATLGTVALAAAPVALGVGLIVQSFADMGKEARESKQAVSDMYDALLQEMHGVEHATDAANENTLAKHHMVDVAKEYDLSLRDTIAALDGNERAHRRVTAAIEAKRNALRKEWSEASSSGQGTQQMNTDKYGGALGDLDKYQRDLDAAVKANAKARAAAREYKRSLQDLADAGDLHAKAELAAMNATEANAAAMDAAGESAVAFGDRLAKLSAIQQSMFHAVQGEASKLPDVFEKSGGGGGGGRSGKTAQERAADVAKANIQIERSTNDVWEAEQKVRESERDLQRARDDAARKQTVVNAQRNVIRAYNDAERATYALQRAEEDLEDRRRAAESGRTEGEARNAVTRALAQVNTARQAFEEAQTALSDAQAGGDPKDVVDAQRKVALAAADLSDATWAAQDAQTNLNRARKEGGGIDRDLREAELNVADAQMAQAASADAVHDSQRDLADAIARLADNEAVIEAEHNLTSAQLDLRSAIQSVTDAQLALTAAQKDESGANAAAGGAGKVKKTLHEYLTDLKKANDEQAQWIQDLYTIYHDPNKGGPAVANELAKMGRDGAGYVHEMATSSTSDVKEMRDALRTHATLASDEFNLGLAGGMTQAKQAMATVLAAIALETGQNVGDITRLLDALGLKFNDIANVHYSITKEADGTYTARNSATGNYQTKMALNAGGDVKNAHQPEIAPGGAWRVWAEPETGGESYIPHANDWRRPQAIRYWQETGRILGVYAGGGVNLSAVKPRIEDFRAAELYQASAFNTATAAWTRLGLSLRARGVQTYAGGGTTQVWRGGSGSGNTAIVVQSGAVKVAVTVGEGANRAQVRETVESAVGAALGEFVRDLNLTLAQRGN